MQLIGRQPFIGPPFTLCLDLLRPNSKSRILSGRANLGLVQTLWHLWTGRLLMKPNCSVVTLVVGSRHSTSIFLGHDLRLRTVRKLRCLWWLRQHLLYLQPENPRGECTRKPRARWTHRWDLRTLTSFVCNHSFWYITNFIFASCVLKKQPFDSNKWDLTCSLKCCKYCQIM